LHVRHAASEFIKLLLSLKKGTQVNRSRLATVGDQEGEISLCEKLRSFVLVPYVPVSTERNVFSTSNKIVFRPSGIMENKSILFEPF
jgi:hypothetical protein